MFESYAVLSASLTKHNCWPSTTKFESYAVLSASLTFIDVVGLNMKFESYAVLSASLTDYQNNDKNYSLRVMLF